MRWNKMHLVLGVCICVAFVLFSAFVGVSVALASATTWHVDDDLVQCPDANFTSIQDAVDAAGAGDIMSDESITLDFDTGTLVDVSTLGDEVKLSTAGGSYEVWRVYDGKGRVGSWGEDKPRLAADSSGNVYVGWSLWDGQQKNFLTIKYDSNGNEVWRATFDDGHHDLLTDMAVDDSGCVYVTGYSCTSPNNDYLTVKYNPDGTESWHRYYDYGGMTSEYGDGAKFIAVGSTGHVYVAGNSRGSEGFYQYREDLLIIKYNPDGSEIWTARYNRGYGYLDEVDGMVIDSLGNVYAVVSSQKTFNYPIDTVTVKYSSQGQKLWSVVKLGLSPRGVAIDGSNNVYTVCEDFNSYDIVLIKYDSNGTELWTRAYDSGDEDIVFGFAVDLLGNAYIASRTRNTSTNDMDYLVVKYSSSGELLWVNRYNRSIHDRVYDLVIDSAGNVYVTGCSSNPQKNYDYLTVKYDTNGNLIWAKTYDSGTHDIASTVMVDSSGNIYVAGIKDYEWEDETGNLVTIKYSQSVPPSNQPPHSLLRLLSTKSCGR